MGSELVIRFNVNFGEDRLRGFGVARGLMMDCVILAGRAPCIVT